MAQSQSQSPPAGGKTNRVYLENTMHLQLPISEEHPEGEVRVLQQGWNEIPPELQNHPMIRRLTPESEGEGQRRQKILDAEKKRQEAITKAEEEYNKELMSAEEDRSEEIKQRTEERAKRIAEAQQMGQVFYEPHPDPDAAHAEALTLPPSMHIVSASGMAYKGDETVAAGQRRNMESGQQQNQGGQPSQGGSGYARQQAAHQTTAPVSAGGEPQGQNKDELTGVKPVEPGATTSSSRTRG